MENKTARRGAGRNGDKHGRDAVEGEDGEGLTFSFLDRLAGGVNGAFIALSRMRPVARPG